MEGWNTYSFADKSTWPAHDEECECLVRRPKRFKKGELELEEVEVRGRFVRVDCGFSEGCDFELPKYNHPVWRCLLPSKRLYEEAFDRQTVIGWRPVLNLN